MIQSVYRDMSGDSKKNL